MSAVALFLGAVVVPVLFASTRTVSVWLGIQALPLAWSVAAHRGVHSAHAAISVVEILVVRGVIAPWLLRRARDPEEAVEDLLPSNLFAWILATAVVALAFEFAGKTPGAETAFALGGVGATVVLALLLLSFNSACVAQIFALLLMENAAVLLESTLAEMWSTWVHGALTCIYVLTVWVGTRLVRQGREEPALDLPRQVL